MNHEQASLLARLESFSLDDAAAPFPFSARLARDEGWSKSYAQRVIREYKRFAFLAVAAGHPVSPSPDVDQVWHLHLLYTQSYWKDFCGEVLGTPLHHHPTKGGPAERGKFDLWYANTRASYRRLFHEDPPHDIWPEPPEHMATVRFNPAAHWLVPKPRLLGPLLREARALLQLCLARPAVGLWLLMLLLFCAGCASDAVAMISPLDWKGPEFLGFYFVALPVACAAAACLRWNWRRPADAPDGPTPPLDAYAVTYLANGPGLTIAAALTRLQQLRAIAVSNPSGQLTAVQPLPENAHPFEQGIYHLVAHGMQSASAIHRLAKTMTQSLVDSLQGQGLVPTDSQAAKATWGPFVLAALVPTLGCIKILVGLSRNRPVEILVAACLLSFVFIGLAFARRPLRTRRGDAVLARLRREHQGLRNKVQSSFSELSGTALPLAIGLYGLEVLAGTPLADLRTSLRPPAAASASGGCGNGGGASCGGGGGDGGGGGGCGGGCGGCGGGS